MTRSHTVTITAGSSTNPSATIFTNYAVPTPSNIDSVAFNYQDGSVQENTYYQGTFQIYCGTDFGSNQASQSKDSSGNTLNYGDVLNILAYSASECMQACLEVNHWNNMLARPSSMLCQTVHFTSLLSQGLTQNGANCWLKNGIPANVASFQNNNDLAVLSAILTSGTNQ
jgi:hypothetical protein